MSPPLAARPHQSPFHDGERAAQARVGLAEKLEPIGQRIIRPTMPDEHRELFEKLPYLVLGAVDAGGQPYATMIAGAGPDGDDDDDDAPGEGGGFVRTPDDHTLQIGALPRRGDPVRAILEERRPGQPVGVLGIELATRRRNRANGEVLAVAEDGFTVGVRQSFGNCPKYIQVRRVAARLPRPAGALAPARVLSQDLPPPAAALVRNADTFFLATTTPLPLRDAAAGADVSHRGGPPGFVAIERDDDSGAAVLVIPDYSGNFLFNTLGNLALEPRCGLVFPDFQTGALLSLTGLAEVSWDDPRIASLPGAQRLLIVRVTSALWLPDALPWRFGAAEPSPYLP